MICRNISYINNSKWIRGDTVIGTTPLIFLKLFFLTDYFYAGFDLA